MSSNPAVLTETNTHIEPYRENRPPKHHQLALLDIMERTLGGAFAGSLLDVGCASGTFLDLVHERFPRAALAGIDVSDELIELAEARLAGTGAHLAVADAARYVAPRRYDVVTASGVHSIFDDPVAVIEHWLTWLAPEGRLFVFGRFNSRPVDTIVYFRDRTRAAGWESGFTSYALETVTDALAAKGFTVGFEPFRLPVTIAEGRDPVRVYTRETVDGECLLVNGANVIAEMYFLTVERRAAR